MILPPIQAQPSEERTITLKDINDSLFKENETLLDIQKSMLLNTSAIDKLGETFASELQDAVAALSEVFAEGGSGGYDDEEDPFDNDDVVEGQAEQLIEQKSTNGLLRKWLDSFNLFKIQSSEKRVDDRGESSTYDGALKGMSVGDSMSAILLGAMAAIVVAATVFVTGFAASFAKQYINIVKTIFKLPLNALRGIFNVLKGTLLSESQLAQVKNIFEGIKVSALKFFSYIEELGTKVTGRFNRLLLPIKTATTNLFSTIGKMSRSILGISDSILDLTKTGLKLFKPFTNFAKVIGRFFGFIAYPLNLFLGISAAVKEFKDGEGKGMVQRVLDSLFAIVREIVVVPLDMVKNAIAWIAEKLGFSGVANMMRGFSFTEIFTSFTSAISKFVQGAFDWVLDLFNNFDMGTLGDTISNGISAMIDDVIAAVMDLINKLNPFSDDGKLASVGDTIQDIGENVMSTGSELLANSKPYLDAGLETISDIGAGIVSLLDKWQQTPAVAPINYSQQSKINSSSSNTQVYQGSNHSRSRNIPVE